MTYPLSPVTWANKIDYLDTVKAADVNQLYAETIAVEGDLINTIKPQLADIATYKDFPASNLVTNGNFANGTTGWTMGSGATHSASEGIYSITGNGITIQPESFQLTTIPCVKNNRIYYKAKVKVTNSLCSNIYLQVRGSTAGNITQNTIVTPTINTLYTPSGITTIIEALTGNLRFFIAHNYVNAATANGKIMEVQEVMAIDLTDTFGAGNEPTATEMDMMLSKFPNGWFDGTVNPLLNHKELYNYMDKRVDLKASVLQEAWIIPTLLNGHTAFSGSLVGYMKDSMGFVHLTGRIAPGAGVGAAYPMFTLLADYFPSSVKMITAPTGIATSFVRLTINGNAVYSDVAFTNYTVLDGFIFRV